jgi:hypothetical protein
MTMMTGLTLRTGVELQQNAMLRESVENMAREALTRHMTEQNLVAASDAESLTWSTEPWYETYEDEEGNIHKDLNKPRGALAVLVIERPVHEGTVAHA